MMTFLQNRIKDARDFQIVFLSLFLLYGIWLLDWDTNLIAYATIFGSCLISQFIGIKTFKIPTHSIKSAIITAIGLCLLLKANSYATYALAGVLSIMSKFVLRVDGKHVFNPSLFGIIVCLLITNDAWISPGQWGNDFTMVAFISGAALMVLFKVGRIDTSLMFLGALMLMEFSRTVVYQGWELDVFFYKFTNGTILLFAFFMITDPVTTPKSFKGRLIWGAAIGILTFVLSNWFQNYTAPIWALLIITPFSILLNYIYKGNSFSWLPSASNHKPLKI